MTIVETNVNERTGLLFIADARVPGDGDAFHGVNPATGAPTGVAYREASVAQVDAAVAAAAEVFGTYRAKSAEQRAAFLRAIARELLALGDTLINVTHDETALPRARLESERTRTAYQLELMAQTLDEGSWVEARIDTGDPARMPLPKPDLRRMLIALGPVAVFSASNFPFAYSVVGGDTASALAAGCPVVCKAHPAHPGASELMALAVTRALKRCDMPPGVFSMVQGWSHETGLALVRHPSIQAVGFTGSLRGGRALYDAAAARPEPIPVYAEMGSVNPVFLLPSALRERSDAIANGLAASMMQGVGQFCTNPGIIVGVASDSLTTLTASLAQHVRAVAAGTMLYEGLRNNFSKGVGQSLERGAAVVAEGGAAVGVTDAAATLLEVDAAKFVAEPALRSEMFGPAWIIVTARDVADLERVAASMEGQLTATIHGTDAELSEHAQLVRLLERRVGRLVFNGYPTGVEVGHAMQHGGPYPASTDGRTTSVGSASIARFARPVCYQNFPDGALAAELRNSNSRHIWRMVNGAFTRDDVA
jgi:alpha-ketoglutaric semialdehyde dehydrogenase